MDTTNLLRPTQIKDTKDEIKRLEYTLMQPDLQDRGEAIRQLRTEKNALDTLSPKPFMGEDLDAAVKEEKELREGMLEGMPSQEEMRRGPAGSLGKHIAWDKKNKDNMLRWKHLMLRLNTGTNDTEVANFEKYRPFNTRNMDTRDAYIPQTTDYHGLENAGSGHLMSDEQSIMLEEVAPDLHKQMALLCNEDRGKVLDLVNKLNTPKVKASKNYTPEEKAAIGLRIAEGRRKAKADREAA